MIIMIIFPHLQEMRKCRSELERVGVEVREQSSARQKESVLRSQWEDQMNLTVAQLTLKEEDVKVCHSAIARLCSFMSNRRVECWEGAGRVRHSFPETKRLFIYVIHIGADLGEGGGLCRIFLGRPKWCSKHSQKTIKTLFW